MKERKEMPKAKGKEDIWRQGIHRKEQKYMGKIIKLNFFIDSNK